MNGLPVSLTRYLDEEFGKVDEQEHGAVSVQHQQVIGNRRPSSGELETGSGESPSSSHSLYRQEVL